MARVVRSKFVEFWKHVFILIILFFDFECIGILEFCFFKKIKVLNLCLLISVEFSDRSFGCFNLWATVHRNLPDVIN